MQLNQELILCSQEAFSISQQQNEVNPTQTQKVGFRPELFGNLFSILEPIYSMSHGTFHETVQHRILLRHWRLYSERCWCYGFLFLSLKCLPLDLHNNVTKHHMGSIRNLIICFLSLWCCLIMSLMKNVLNDP